MRPRDRFGDMMIVFLGMLAFVLALAVGTLALAGCGGAEKRVGVALATCSAKLAADVAVILDHNNPTLESELADIAKVAGLDAIQCAIDIYEALKRPASPPSLGSAGSATPAIASAKPSAVARARAWLAKRRG